MQITSEGLKLVAIRCEGIGKRYKIGRQQRYLTFRESLTEMVKTPIRKFSSSQLQARNDRDTELWALKGVDLEVDQGEVLGIIGRNGSGKSTILKILSRITRPTEGNAEIIGRVGTLLEVGTGFHPELTGRENIYLYGAILGMNRAEIVRKFDEIVDFSECSKLLDTPMKRYSSGMYVRLAFAVAAHLETELLLVDEVLAVGDAIFQKKCMGKMGEVAHQGRTVLFVSHNMVAVENLCTRAICLHDGRLVLEGPTSSVTSRYLRDWIPVFKERVYPQIESAPGNEIFRLHRARVRPLSDDTNNVITVRTPLVVEFQYWKLSARTVLTLLVGVFNEHGIHLFNTAVVEEASAPLGLISSSFIVPADLMNNGTYRIKLSVHDNEEIACWEDLVTFEVHDASSELRGDYHGEWLGAIRPNMEWKTKLLGPLPHS